METCGPGRCVDIFSLFFSVSTSRNPRRTYKTNLSALWKGREESACSGPQGLRTTWQRVLQASCLLVCPRGIQRGQQSRKPHSVTLPLIQGQGEERLSTEKSFKQYEYLLPPAQLHEINCGSTPTHISKGQVGSLDVYLHGAIAKLPKIPPGWCQGSSEGRQDSDISPFSSNKTPPFLLQCLEEALMESEDFHLNTSQGDLPPHCQRRPHGNPELPVPLSNEDALLQSEYPTSPVSVILKPHN